MPTAIVQTGTTTAILQTGTTTAIVISPSDVVVSVGGPSGGKAKQVGAKPLAQKQIEELLGDRPTILSNGESVARLVTTSKGKSKYKLMFAVAGECLYTPLKIFSGYSIAKLLIPVKAESQAKVKRYINALSKAQPEKIYTLQHTANKKIEKLTKLLLLSFMELSDKLDDDKQ